MFNRYSYYHNKNPWPGDAYVYNGVNGERMFVYWLEDGEIDCLIGKPWLHEDTNEIIPKTQVPKNFVKFIESNQWLLRIEELKQFKRYLTEDGEVVTGYLTK